MKAKQFFPFPVFIVFIFTSFNLDAQTDLKLWYTKPARTWNEALPIGNGRLGAMIFGGTREELMQLNEGTLWSGGPINSNPNPLAKQYLGQIREALFKEQYEIAEELTKKMQGLFTESYEPLGDLKFKFDFEGEPLEYYRDLNISNAIATTRFKASGVEFSREYFSSAPDQVIVVRLTASKQGALNFALQTSSPLYFENGVIDSSEVAMRGYAPSHTDPSYLQSLEIPVVYNDPTGCRGMRYELRVRAQLKDGKVLTSEGVLKVQGATEVILLISAATSFNGFDKCPDSEGKDERKAASEYLQKASVRNFGELKADHVDDFHHYFNRVSLALGNTQFVDLPTDERLKRYTDGGKDNGLEVLYFQFGRYLLISSSRPGGTAANLQGIWNHHVRPPWSSNYTTNINAEMNYWMAESCNLSELHEPLLQLIGQLAITGKATVKNFYGASGWTVHHNTDIWATTNPVSGSPMWANWPMGGAWLSQHLWEHYQFTGDKKYLKDVAYPLMMEAAEFCLDWLVEKQDGLLVTAPSTSPENVYVNDKGFKGTVSVATTMDMSLIWDLFTNVIQASQRLDTDVEFRKMLLEKRAKLYPLKIGKKGNLQEWYKDWEDEDPQHRHISHLFGLFPGRQISIVHTPELANAVRKSMELRGDGGTGWSKGWKINIWARLHDGNRAHKLIREQLTLTGVEGTDYANGGGTYPNLFDAHPPFQIDGNFGGTSGMTEMLLQSHDEAIVLLPALPDDWASGSVRGLKARGGFTLDITWRNKKISEVKVHAAVGGNVRIMCSSGLKGRGVTSATNSNPNQFYQPVNVRENRAQQVAPNGMKVIDLATEKDKTYVLKGL